RTVSRCSFRAPIILIRSSAVSPVVITASTISSLGKIDAATRKYVDGSRIRTVLIAAAPFACQSANRSVRQAFENLFPMAAGRPGPNLDIIHRPLALHVGRLGNRQAPSRAML